MRLKQRAKHALNRASTVLVATLLFAGASGGTAAASELFSVLPDGKIVEKSERHFTYFPLITAVNKGKIDTNRVGGRLTRVAWELPPSYEPFHAVNNYKAQVEKLGGEVLFHCQGEQECGRAKSIIATLQPKDTISNSGPTVFTARITSEAKTLYISLYSAKFQKRTGLQFDILEVMPEPLDLVSVDKGYLDKPTAPMTFKDMSAKDLKGSKDHPMIQRLPGARINKYIHHGFGQGLVMTGITKGKHHVVPVDGKVTDIGYELPRQYSEYEVFANYQAALNKLGFTPRFRCQGSQCGNKDRLEKALNTLVHIGFEENQYYGLYHLERAEGNIHAMVYVIGFPGSLWAELRVIEESELNDERLVIDLEGLNDNIAQTGHVALDGLLFEYDSDRMLPESDDVLETLATYLKQHQDWQFYVVGHTDDKGTQPYNEKLATKRATAVVSALTKQFKIPRKQLAAQGVGEYSPVANNQNEDGRKQNRRVELVLRSDSK